ncbi:unnamed protein product [Protopolystoma xenopodis]|uniref:Uncharacterized protein n=1 Tax=Protopolystoma xenopodis TaxID=117903 RepID=A0A448XR24_9PLAT|nr:unnamed protein product [Protopolystoma xenopodis]
MLIQVDSVLYISSHLILAGQQKLSRPRSLTTSAVHLSGSGVDWPPSDGTQVAHAKRPGDQNSDSVSAHCMDSDFKVSFPSAEISPSAPASLPAVDDTSPEDSLLRPPVPFRPPSLTLASPSSTSGLSPTSPSSTSGLSPSGLLASSAMAISANALMGPSPRSIPSSPISLASSSTPGMMASIVVQSSVSSGRPPELPPRKSSTASTNGMLLSQPSSVHKTSKVSI